MHFITILWVMFIGVSVYLGYEAWRMAMLVGESRELVRTSQPFSKVVPQASKHILVLGDSTAVGTGVADPSNSTAGRLARVFPEATIENRAQNGFRLADLEKQLQTFDANEHFDLVLIHIGANDILYLTSISQIAKESVVVFSQAKKMGEKVVVLHSGNVGDAPFWPWFLRPLFTSRSDQVRALYLTQAETYGFHYVDLIAAPTAHLFRQDPERYHATDQLHLSDDGYGLWFAEIQKQL